MIHSELLISNIYFYITFIFGPTEQQQQQEHFEYTNAYTGSILASFFPVSYFLKYKVFSTIFYYLFQTVYFLFFFFSTFCVEMPILI